MSIVKDPDARLDYAVSWSEWLSDGESIVSTEWIIPDGIDKVSDTFSPSTAWVWLEGGEAGATYRLVCRINTDQNRQDDRSLFIDVLDR